MRILFQKSSDVTNDHRIRACSAQNLSYTDFTAHNFSGVNVHTLVAICLLAATANGPLAHTVNLGEPPVTQPALVKIPKGPNGLTLYNEKGERVAQCEKKDDAFSNCKIEPGMTFDDVMNAWVHAFQDIESK
jgi:hypothetical protein